MISALHILLIEDEPHVADMVEEMLLKDEQLVAEFTNAASLRDGISIMSSKEVDLVILDLNLQDSKGMATLERLKKRYSDTPVIVLTGEGTDETGRKAIGAGALEFLLKTDLTPRVINSAVCHAMERQVLLDQLTRQKDDLERAVDERTASLAATVQKLKLEIHERQKAEQAHKAAFENSVQRENEKSALLNSAKAILTHRRFNDAAKAVFDICKELLGATAGYVALLSPNGQENELLFLEAGGRPCTVNPELPMPIRGLREVAYKTGRTVYDNDFMNSKWMEFMPQGHAALDNVLFAPLNVEGRTAGIMGLANKPGGFDRNDAELAAAMGEVVSIALMNSRTLESLRDSQLRFHELFNKMSSGVAIYQADPNCEKFFIKEMNRSGEKMTKLSQRDYQDKDVLEVFSGLESMGMLEAFKRVWQSGDAEFIPASLYQDERISRWFENYVYQLPGGELVHVFDDITNKMVAQDALRKSEERYRNLVSHCPDPIIIYDAEGKVISTNPAFENKFGWSLGELKGTRLDFVPEESMAETKRALEKMTNGRPVINFETKRATKQGDILVTDISASVYRDDQKNLSGYVVFLRDISERKALEKQLKQNERNLRTILGSLPAGVVMIDKQTNSIEYVNPVAAKMIQAPVKEIIGRKCHSFICTAEEGKCPVYDCHQKMEKSERALLTAKGEEIPILKTVVEIQLGGKGYLLESFIDISELKKSQAEQLARNALQATIETAGAACHELNQPLQAIMNLADAVLDELSPEKPLYGDIKDIIEYTKTIAEVTHKLSNLTSHETTAYSESTNILDLDRSSKLKK